MKIEEEAKTILAEMTDEEKEKAALVGIMYELYLIRKAVKAIKELIGNG